MELKKKKIYIYIYINLQYPNPKSNLFAKPYHECIQYRESQTQNENFPKKKKKKN